MRSRPVRVGTRGSLLARTQTEWILARLREKHAGVRFEVVVIRTSGDVRTQQMPARFAGKGFFTKEIEDALLAGDVDLAVHSLKDLPTECPQGLELAAIPAREDPRDVLVGCTTSQLAEEPGRFRIGTSSLRRAAQLRRAFPGCEVVNLRGNIDTRLRKIRDREVDGGVLAAAGLLRLGRQNEIGEYFTAEHMLPAPGQGALAIEVRSDDECIRALLASIHCLSSARSVDAERAFMQGLGGGCQLPVAAWAKQDGDNMELRGRVLSLDGRRCFEGTRHGPAERAGELGRWLAAQLQQQGAGEVIREVEEEWMRSREHD